MTPWCDDLVVLEGGGVERGWVGGGLSPPSGPDFGGQFSGQEKKAATKSRATAATGSHTHWPDAIYTRRQKYDSPCSVRDLMVVGTYKTGIYCLLHGRGKPVRRTLYNNIRPEDTLSNE